MEGYVDKFMKAMQLNTPKPIEQFPLQIEEVPEPCAGKGQIRIRVLACGVCHTDLHIVEGELKPPKFPLIPGHQVVGVIDQIGQCVTGFQIGDRVGAPWLAYTCGKCSFCQNGKENLCPNIKFHGFHVDGGFAEMMAMDVNFTVHLPENQKPENTAPLLCAGIIGFRSIKLAGIQPGDVIGLIGFGASAHLSLQVIKGLGCKAYVFTRARIHQEHALRLGADWAGEISATAPSLCHHAILFAPSGDLVPASLAKIHPGGTLVVNAITMTDIPSYPYSRIYGERVLKSVANATRQDAREFMDWVSTHGIEVHTTSYSLSDANLALMDMKASQVNGDAVIQF
jgi:propanol-preferring alcohol dehydrogenase